VLRRRSNETRAFPYAFDLWELDGTDLRRDQLRPARPRWRAFCVRAGSASVLTSTWRLTVFQHACRLGCEGIVSKRVGSRYRSGRSSDWLKFKNPQAPAVSREAEEEWR
jgi:bifunctional non-homologous end joining protein LigD